MKLPNEQLLVDLLAYNCYTAQQHIDDADAWDTNGSYREELLQCTSYQTACWLAQNTIEGEDGVGWDVVLEPLVEHPMKSLDQWRGIIQLEVEQLGGFGGGKSDEPSLIQLVTDLFLLARIKWGNRDEDVNEVFRAAERAIEEASKNE